MRNLVLLLSSGHTVRVKLRDGDLTEPSETDRDRGVSWSTLNEFFDSMPAVVGYTEDNITLAYIEDPSFPGFKPGGMEFEDPNEFQRIEAFGPADAGGTA